MTQKNARFFARSLTVSVLPVPAGPYGAPALHSERALVKVIYARSVKAVITRRPLLP